MPEYTEVRGCIHIHFPLRELDKRINSLGKAGEMAGVDFIVVNNHTPKKIFLKHEKTFNKEGYYGKTLVLTGEETDDRKKQNHLLVIGGKRWYGNKDTVEDIFFEISTSDIVSFIAHPDGFHKLFLFKKEYLWENWEIDGFTGIEVWSMLFDWARYTRIYNLPLRYFTFPENLRGPAGKVLYLWDTISLKRKVVGIAGLDIHPLPFLFQLLDINKSFRYHNIFKGLRNHLLLKEPLAGDSQEDKKKIMDCLKKGHLFFANDGLADSSGFFFGTEDGEKTMGDTVYAGTILYIKNPFKAKTKIVCNGKILYNGETELKKFTPEIPGVYRIEVELNGKPWIFSNHIRLI
ncbi:MAG TPA: hypothetical protein PLQ41_04790 [bacterium]|nr:hypothetical protein [bacterium]HPP30322.1 hypothetical protein [bacterium]